jgi:glutaredoxin
VVLYTAPPCEKPCQDAKSFLTARGVPHRVVDLADLASFERFKKETGASEVPVLSVGELVLKGFEPGGWTHALDQAGYPKTAPARRPARAAAPPPPPRRGRYESSLPAPPPSIRLYVSPDCGEPCDQARKYLSGRGVRATEISTADPAGFADLQTVSGGTTVPSLVVGSRVVKGFQATQYDAALDARSR